MKPAISKIIPFDATAGYVFSFSYIGNQPYKNRIVIRNALTNEIIKDETISEMRFRHPISGNILTNGTSYTIQISVLMRIIMNQVYLTKYYLLVILPLLLILAD